MKFNSIKFKITFLQTVLLGSIIFLNSFFLYFSLYKTLYDELDGELEQKAAHIAQAINQYINIFGGAEDDSGRLPAAARRTISPLLSGRDAPPEILSPEQRQKLREWEKQWKVHYETLNLNEDFILMVDQYGDILAKSKKMSNGLLHAIFQKQMPRTGHPVSYSQVEFRKRNLRLLQVPFLLGAARPYFLYVASSQKPIVHILQERQFYIMISIPIFLMISIGFGNLLAQGILRQMKMMVRTMQTITYDSYRGRLDMPYEDVEIEQLGEALNGMIQRLEKSFAHISEFSSHVAHELKTPLAILRGECELALRKDRNNSEYKAAITACQEEVHRMLRIVDDLLLLARLDFQPEIFKFEAFDGNGFFQELYEQCEFLAREKQIAVTIDMPDTGFVITADRLHLRRAFFNILHNSIKFTGARGAVHIGIQVSSVDITVTITDNGIGIAPENLPRIFDRFFHTHHGDGKSEAGNGLGLNIAQSIITIHHGTVSVSSKLEEGTCFVITLPSVPDMQ